MYEFTMTMIFLFFFRGGKDCNWAKFNLITSVDSSEHRVITPKSLELLSCAQFWIIMCPVLQVLGNTQKLLVVSLYLISITNHCSVCSIVSSWNGWFDIPNFRIGFYIHCDTATVLLLLSLLLLLLFLLLLYILVGGIRGIPTNHSEKY
jgi:hypothetical protein